MGIFDTLGKRDAPTGQQRASYDAMMQDVVTGEVLDFFDRVRLGQTPCPPARQGKDL